MITRQANKIAIHLYYSACPNNCNELDLSMIFVMTKCIFYHFILTIMLVFLLPYPCPEAQKPKTFQVATFKKKLSGGCTCNKPKKRETPKHVVHGIFNN